MGRSGPAPIPPRLKLLTGNAGHRPIRPGVELAPVAPRKPAWSKIFPKPKAGPYAALRADADFCWDQIVPSLERAGLLAFVDVFVLIEACVCWARIRQVERRLSEDGLVILNDRQARGYVRHPLATVGAQYRSQFRFLVGELGLSPSARGRLDAAMVGVPGSGPAQPAGSAASAAAELLDG